MRTLVILAIFLASMNLACGPSVEEVASENMGRYPTIEEIWVACNQLWGHGWNVDEARWYVTTMAHVDTMEAIIQVEGVADDEWCTANVENYKLQ